MLRFRPILMTTMAALLGALLGARNRHGSLRRPLGITIIGGLCQPDAHTVYDSGRAFTLTGCNIGGIVPGSREQIGPLGSEA
jgi:hypothetical protein